MSKFKIIKNHPLELEHTMHFDVFASSFCLLHDQQDIDELLFVLDQFPSFFILGGGSNVIFLKNFEGLVVKLLTKGIKHQDTDDENSVLVTAKAGESWHDFVMHCIKQGWFGLENLSLIPGTVGAAPVQNIGAYGVEVKDFIAKVHCVDLSSGKKSILTGLECHFSYRNSFFKKAENKNLLITEVEFLLSKKFNPNFTYGELERYLSFNNIIPTAKSVAYSVIAIRQKKIPNPDTLGNVGSFFHNPIVSKEKKDILLELYPEIPCYPTENNNLFKLAAGWMIDYLGFKGLRCGGMQVYPNQALILTNADNASPQDLTELVSRIKKKVFEVFQINLTVEPIILE